MIVSYPDMRKNATGIFEMGSDHDRKDERPRHQVYLDILNWIVTKWPTLSI